MKGKSFIVLAVLFLCACPASALIEFKDGLTHDIDYEIDDDVYVDYQTPYMYTTLNWLDGASMEDKYFYYSQLREYEHSRINICGGSIPLLKSLDSSHVDIFGGSIKVIYGSDSCQVNIFGGSIDNYFLLFQQSKIQIFGSDFAVDGQPVGYGEITSIYGGFLWDEPIRRLTGTLLNGGFIDTDFYIGHDARIVLVPEPASAMILGLGSLIVYYRRRR